MTENVCILGTARASVAECDVGGAGEGLGRQCVRGLCALPVEALGLRSVCNSEAAGGRWVGEVAAQWKGREVGGSERHV